MLAVNVVGLRALIKQVVCSEKICQDEIMLWSDLAHQTFLALGKEVGEVLQRQASIASGSYVMYVLKKVEGVRLEEPTGRAVCNFGRCKGSYKSVRWVTVIDWCSEWNQMIEVHYSGWLRAITFRTLGVVVNELYLSCVYCEVVLHPFYVESSAYWAWEHID